MQRMKCKFLMLRERVYIFFIHLHRYITKYIYKKKRAHHIKNISRERLDEYKKKILPYFDEEYYRKHYALELLNQDFSPIDHYLLIGDLKGYNPCSWFQSSLYQKFFPCVENSFFHWIKKKYVYQKNQCHQPITISLTSWPGRIEYAWLSIESLLSQYHSFSYIYLWLSTKQFPNKEKDLPETLLIQKTRGLTIKWCEENLLTYKKWLYSVFLHPNAFIITADDDNFYHSKWLTFFIKKIRKYKRFDQEKLFIAYRGQSKGRPWCGSGNGVCFFSSKIYEYIKSNGLHFINLSPFSDDTMLTFLSFALDFKRKYFTKVKHPAIINLLSLEEKSRIQKGHDKKAILYNNLLAFFGEDIFSSFNIKELKKFLKEREYVLKDSEKIFQDTLKSLKVSDPFLSKKEEETLFKNYFNL